MASKRQPCHVCDSIVTVELPDQFAGLHVALLCPECSALDDPREPEAGGYIRAPSPVPGALIPLGSVLLCRGATEALAAEALGARRIGLDEILGRHARGDWDGECGVARNNLAAGRGPVGGFYQIPDGPEVEVETWLGGGPPFTVVRLAEGDEGIVLGTTPETATVEDPDDDD